MPQLMPLNWIISSLMLFMFMMMILLIYSNYELIKMQKIMNKNKFNKMMEWFW